MKKYIALIIATLSLIACIKPDERQRDSSTELSALKAYVYYDDANLSIYEEVDLLSGMYIEDKGLASYTFPDDKVKFNESTLKRCRLEAIIPATAKIVSTDENGKEKDYGLDGWHNLNNSTIYFNIVADNGGRKSFKIQTRCLN